MTHAWYLNTCADLDLEHQNLAKQRQQQLTKPTGSLGELEHIVIALAAMQSKTCPHVTHPWISIFAADHGVMQEKISAYPQQVTRQMLFNFAHGGACIAIMAKHYQAELEVIDCGTVGEPYQVAGVHQQQIAQGTSNFLHQPAMSIEQCVLAMNIGKDSVERAHQSQSHIFIAGEMGIGNTCSAAALAGLLLDESAQDLTGLGTGINEATLQRKTQVVAEAIIKYRSEVLNQPLFALATVGGFEIAAMVGAYIRCAQLGIPMLIDGFISSIAALCAVRLNPKVRYWMLFAHQSAEYGHQRILHALNATPILQLGLRLGEGSGAGTALAIIQLACEVHQNMATFADAEISNKS